MNAAALIVLILALIAIGMILYYAVICMQIRDPKKRSKPPCNSDMGPLLNNEEDYNGNHEEPVRTEEDRPSELPEASAPKSDDDYEPASKDGDIEIPMKSVSFKNTPECASIKPSSKEGSIALDIDEEPPVLDNSKSVLQPSHDRVLGPKAATTANLQKSCDEMPPRIIGNEPRYNVMSDSYEEDGLLVPGSQNKNLQKEPRKRLHAQRSAPPEGYVPHQQLLVQKNPQTLPKHVQFANPQSKIETTIPIIVTNLPVGSTNQTVRPKLKSPLSDPGTSKENNIFVFGANHEIEVYEEKPVKKVKMADEDEVSRSNLTHDHSPPAVGWVVNIPQSASNFSENKKVVLNIDDDDENQNSTILPLATSEVDHSSVRTNERVFTSSPGYISNEGTIKSKTDFDQMTRSADSDSLNNDDTSDLPSKEIRLNIEPQETSGSESSEPDLTEYSFERGPHSPDPAVSTVLENEVSCYAQDQIGLTHYVPIPETTHVPKSNQQSIEERNVIGHAPPTPTSDTKSVSPISSNDNSLEEIKAPSPSFNPTNVLGTPPQTPPIDEITTYIPENPILNETNESIPTFIVIDTHNSQRRSSSDSLSSSLTSTSSSSNGSYKLETTNNDLKNVQVVDTEKNNNSNICKMKD